MTAKTAQRYSRFDTAVFDYFSSTFESVYTKIMDEPIVMDPFPHLTISNIFPSNFYQDILENLPEKDQYVSQTYARQPRLHVYANRFEFKLTPEKISTLPSVKKHFWTTMCEYLLSEKLMNGLLSKFCNELKTRFQTDDLRDLRPHPVACLNRDCTGYSLGPHTDAPKKLFVILFYLPKDNSLSHLGTSIFKPKDMTVTDKTGAHFPFEAFDEISMVPYSPNSMLLSCWNNRSWHGVKKIHEENVERDAIMYNINDRRLEAIEELDNIIIK